VSIWTGIAAAIRFPARYAAVYDAVQRIAGDLQLQQRLALHFGNVPPGSRVVDFGGGTGRLAARLPDRIYICLDSDIQKLRSFVSRSRNGVALVASATRSPIRTASADAVLCIKVTHHLTDSELEAMLGEAARIVRPGGVLIVADAIRSPRWMSRLLWSLDRGSHPRTVDLLERMLPAAYRPVGQERFRLRGFHDFWLCIASRTSQAR
jgi:ubiquinone/menaquinone biosynthesis C-methylase UbiE